MAQGSTYSQSLTSPTFPPTPDHVLCTLVLPTYNASDFIEHTCNRLARFLREHPHFQVLFVCDGCKDDTVQKLAKLLPAMGPRAKVHAYEKNRGKGYAVRTGLSLADTPYMIFTDVDLAYEPDDAESMLDALRGDKASGRRGADMVVVNRASPDSTFLISPRDFGNIYKRHLMSRAFNLWLRRMLPIRILDTQAGFKGMTASAWSRLAPRLECDGFFFDTEMLAHAGALGLDIRQTPAHFKYLDPTTVKMVSHGWSMIWDTLKLRRRLKHTYGKLKGDYTIHEVEADLAAEK
jgi:dolichyl-phosphate beta-glucosyltransferase